MFTVKLSMMHKHDDGNGKEYETREVTVIETPRVPVRHCRAGELVGLDCVDQHGECFQSFYLTKNGEPASGIGDAPYYQAIIENSLGKTTEIIRL